MSRTHPVRSFKVCRICGEGYDAFKSRDARGRYCSPECLAEARRRHREGSATQDAAADQPVVGAAILPPSISLGNRNAIVPLGPDLETGDDRRRLI